MNPASRLALAFLSALACCCAIPSSVRAGDSEQALRALIARVSPSFVMIAGGSGVIISADGLMLTNHHVIAAMYARQGATLSCHVRVDGVFRRARLLGTDPRGDISLLRIEVKPGERLAFCPLADSSRLLVGQEVIAVGNPFGAMQVIGDPSISTGIISLLHRNQGTYTDAIQTDAAVNPGNSGGPLVTMDGQVAGINGQIQSKTGARANTGIGLAIPANQIKAFIPHLLSASGGIVVHGVLRGLVLNDAESDGIRNGAEIQAPRPGTLAATAGLRAGDVIIAVDGQRVGQASRLLGLIGTYPAKSTITLRVRRGEKTLDLPVTLASFDPGSLGFAVEQPTSPAERQRLVSELLRNPQKIQRPVIASLSDPASALSNGIKIGDRIVSLGGIDVPNLLHFERVQRDLFRAERFFAGDTLSVVIERNGTQITLPIVLTSSTGQE